MVIEEIPDDYVAKLGTKPPRVMMAEHRQMILIPRTLFEQLRAHYLETAPIRSKQPKIDVRDLIARL